MQLSSLRNWV